MLNCQPLCSCTGEMLERSVCRFFLVHATEMNFLCRVRRHHCVYKPTDKMAKLSKFSCCSSPRMYKNQCQMRAKLPGAVRCLMLEGGLRLAQYWCTFSSVWTWWASMNEVGLAVSPFLAITHITLKLRRMGPKAAQLLMCNPGVHMSVIFPSRLKIVWCRFAEQQRLQPRRRPPPLQQRKVRPGLSIPVT